MHNRTTGYKQLKATFVLTHGDSNLWGSTLDFQFGIAEVLTHAGDGDVPANWEFRDSPVHNSDNGLPEFEDWPDSEIYDMLVSGEITSDDLREFGQVLTKYAGLLKSLGKDY